MIRVSVSSVTCVARIPHVIAEGIHTVAPRVRSRYTVHAVAVSIMSAGFRMGHCEHAAVEWFIHHTPRIVSILADLGWEPFSELLTGIGMSPYLDSTTRKIFDALKPPEKTEPKK